MTAPVKVEEERCTVCSYSLAAHRKQPPERSQFVCNLYLEGDAGAVPKVTHTRPKYAPRVFGMFEADE